MDNYKKEIIDRAEQKAEKLYKIFHSYANEWLPDSEKREFKNQPERVKNAWVMTALGRAKPDPEEELKRQEQLKLRAEKQIKKLDKDKTDKRLKTIKFAI